MESKMMMKYLHYPYYSCPLLVILTAVLVSQGNIKMIHTFSISKMISVASPAIYRTQQYREHMSMTKHISSTSTIRSKSAFLLSLSKSYNIQNQNDDDEVEEDDEDDYIPDSELSNSDPTTFFQSYNENKNKILSFGLRSGKSSPNQRKAFGKSGSSVANVFVCTNCSAEFVKWIGKCPTCQEWNTVEEFQVGRQSSMMTSSMAAMRRMGLDTSNSNRGYNSFSNSKSNTFAKNNTESNGKPPSSWLTGINNPIQTNNIPIYDNGLHTQPIRITDIYQEMGYNRQTHNVKNGKTNTNNFKENRIQVPNDFEINNVLGGGIMPGSIILLGGDPGIGKSTLLLQIAGSLAALSKAPRGIGMGTEDTDTTDKDSENHGPVLYISGEENARQIASRSIRLGIEESELLLLCETDADFITEVVLSLYYNAELPSHDDNSLFKSQIDHDNYEENDSFNSYDEINDTFEKHTTNTKRNKQSTKRMNKLLHYQQRTNKKPSLLIIDSIQTMVSSNGGTSSAGGVTQVRECVGIFLRLAKSTGIPIILVGHVTKSGDVAGPRTVEHMVDVVLYLEQAGDNGSGGNANLRILRSSKNRFGSSDEIGVYEMNTSSSSSSDGNGGIGGGRLIPVSDPSSLFLANREETEDVEGCAICIIVEGRRSMTVEIQALVSPTNGASSSSSSSMYSGRRTVNGISISRLWLILAVLQKRCHVHFNRHDVYVNVCGMKLNTSHKGGSSDVNSNASDIAIAVALVSSLSNIPIRSDTAFVGEMGLLGELRIVPSIDKRVSEARRMGFSRVVIPYTNTRRGGSGRATTTTKGWRKGVPLSSSLNDSTKNGNWGRSRMMDGIECIECRNVLEAINAGLVSPLEVSSRRRGKNQKSKLNETQEHEPYDNNDDSEFINSVFHSLDLHDDSNKMIIDDDEIDDD